MLRARPFRGSFDDDFSFDASCINLTIGMSLAVETMFLRFPFHRNGSPSLPSPPRHRFVPFPSRKYTFTENNHPCVSVCVPVYVCFSSVYFLFFIRLESFVSVVAPNCWIFPLYYGCSHARGFLSRGGGSIEPSNSIQSIRTEERGSPRSARTVDESRRSRRGPPREKKPNAAVEFSPYKSKKNLLVNIRGSIFVIDGVFRSFATSSKGSSGQPPNIR